MTDKWTVSTYARPCGLCDKGIPAGDPVRLVVTDPIHMTGQPSACVEFAGCGACGNIPDFHRLASELCAKTMASVDRKRLLHWHDVCACGCNRREHGTGGDGSACQAACTLETCKGFRRVMSAVQTLQILHEEQEKGGT